MCGQEQRWRLRTGLQISPAISPASDVLTHGFNARLCHAHLQMRSRLSWPPHSWRWGGAGWVAASWRAGCASPQRLDKQPAALVGDTSAAHRLLSL